MEDRIPKETEIDEIKLKNSKIRRANALAKWVSKFEKKFHLHFDGEFKIKSKRGIEKLEGTGGHNHSVIGQNVKVRRYLTEPVDDMPFDALIEVRYKNGQWIEKTAKSCMFPKNWNITRVKEEIALVYDEMIKSGKTFNPQSINRKFDFPCSTGHFRIQIEFDELGNLTNAYPIVN
ncbi:hypothetical protein [Cloacibacterium sp. TD35]|uniref:hypothetical protein n=1 Tax=Cloacibacterium sp. TD35 TaxID=2976818 RepID=UPI00237DE0F6|nr:hypothetical protein [Cloacibacterium sp. TD35]WDT67887.1 EndoU domain-containing protein [Cloacibacterium sp. TD35]